MSYEPMIYSINIEWMEEFLPDHLDWRAICPQLAIFYGWLHFHDFLDASYRDIEPYLSSFKNLETDSISIPEFINTCFDGELTDECIKDASGKDFFGDYCALNYTSDLEAFFKVKNEYEVPQEWQKCKTFYEVLDRRFNEFKNNVFWEDLEQS